MPLMAYDKCLNTFCAKIEDNMMYTILTYFFECFLVTAFLDFHSKPHTDT